MRKIKKVIAVTVVTAIMAASVDMGNVMAAQNSETEVIERVANEVTENSDFDIQDGVLVKYLGTSGDVVIPEGVTSIGEEAFYECSNLNEKSNPPAMLGRIG